MNEAAAREGGSPDISGSEQAVQQILRLAVWVSAAGQPFTSLHILFPLCTKEEGVGRMGGYKGPF